MTVVIRNLYRCGKYRNAREIFSLIFIQYRECLETERKIFISLQQQFETFFDIVNIQRNAREHIFGS
jgi:hypothetical protein